MTKRQLITWGLLLLVFGTNVFVWLFYNRAPPVPFASRDVVRSQLSEAWDDEKSIPVADVAAAMKQLAEVTDQSESVVRGEFVSFNTLAAESRRDLVSAIGDLVVAISSADPTQLLSYMRIRGMNLDERRLDDAQHESGQPEAAQLHSRGEAKFEQLWRNSATGSRWVGLVPKATFIRVWRPPSIRFVSIVQLGETASWAWGNERLYESVFVSRPSYEQVNRKETTPIADVRLLIEHDESMNGERALYFIRLWKPSDKAKWQPLAIKLVRTAPDADAPPRIVW